MARQIFNGLIVTIILIVTAFCGTDARAGEVPRTQNIFVEFFGESNNISVNYDTRFTSNSAFGWRVGLGWSFSSFKCEKGSNYRPGISLPIGVNALFGSQPNMFEVGLDISPGIYAFRESKTIIEEETSVLGKYHKDYGPTKWRAGCSLSLDIGYRLQRQKGFNFRVGISPTISINSDHMFIHFMSLIPYLSFGYSFK